MKPTRRDILTIAGAAPALAQTRTAKPRTAKPPPAKKRIAAIVTEYRWFSHADVICGRFLAGYSANNIWTPPRTQLVSLYTAQVPPTDMSLDMSARHGFKIYPTVAEALTLGGKSLAVDGVVFVGEHGDYPTNDVGQKLYPRYELFSQILDLYEASGRSVPTLFDKHFSYSWEKADRIYQRSKKLGFPMMAGSSIPVALRSPEGYEIPNGTPIAEAVAIGHGDLDAYGFHLLEGLQCLVERRKGAETGIASVEWIEGDAIWKWRDSERGSWSKPLLEEAMRLQPLRKPVPIEEQANRPALFLLRYRDGMMAAALMLTRGGNDRTYAMRVPGQDKPLSVVLGVDTKRPLPHFDGFVRCADELMDTGNTPYPVERTLLTTKALSLCFESRRAGKALDTPQLQVEYRAPAHQWFQRA